MPKITIDDRGVVEELPLNPTSLTITHLSGATNPVLTTDENGLFTPKTLAKASRFEYHEHSGGTQVASTSYTPIQIDGVLDNYDGGLYTWNTSSHTFYPEEIGTIWTVRFTGQVEPVGGNPYFHLDFILSGSDPEATVGFRHHQSHEQLIRNISDHIHIQTVFVVFADEDLHVSGGSLVMHTSTGEINLLSASVLIKEG